MALLASLVPASAGTAEAAVTTYTDPASFAAAIVVQRTTTFEGLDQAAVPDGTLIDDAVYTFTVAGGASGLVTSAFLAVSPASTLGVARDPSQPLLNFFYPGDSVTLTFAQPIQAIGAYFSSAAAGSTPGFLSIATPVGTAVNGDPLPAGTFGFPAETLRFVGISSDSPFAQATFGITNPSPGNVGFVLDNVIVGRPATGASAGVGSRVTSRVSVTTDGAEAGSAVFRPMLSGNGRFVTFDTGSPLDPDDSNGFGDVYVHDRVARTTERASVASNGSQALGGHSCYASLSADGRFVAFQSDAGNLVPNDTNGASDVFVHDRVTGVTTRVSVATGGGEANQGPGLCFSMFPVISADGRFVAFASDATNLVPGDTNGVGDVFVHDRQTGTTTRVSVGHDGSEANGPSGFYNGIAISASGRFVAFQSDATNLVQGDTNGARDVFVRDLVGGTTSRVSVASDGSQANNQSVDGVAISPDGRFVAFASDATNLVAGDLNGTRDIFLHDRLTGATALISVASDGRQGDRLSITPALSEDGRFVVFQSFATNLVPGDANGVDDIFIHDRLTRTTQRIVGSDGAEANCALLPGQELVRRISFASADGRIYAFESCASNLVPGDTNGITDVFVARLASGPNWLITGPGVGGASRLRGFDANGDPTLLQRSAFAGFTEGVNVAVGDVNGDGSADLIVGAAGGSALGPRVRVFSGSTADTVLADFEANDPGAPGGINVAACDLASGGRAHIITGPGPGGGTRVRVWHFDPATGAVSQVASFLAYDSSPGGVRVACADVDGTGRPSIITGPGPGRPPLVRVFTVDLQAGAGTEQASFLAYPAEFLGGVSVAAADVRRRGRASIVTGPGAGMPPLVRVWTLGPAGAPASGRVGQRAPNGVNEEGSFLPYAENSLGGVNVAAGDTTGTGGARVVTGPGPGAPPEVRTFELGGAAPQLQQSVMAENPDFRGGVAPAAPPVTGAAPGPPPTATVFVLVVTRAGAGTGTVTSSPAGIACGATCAVSYGVATTLVLTAEPAGGSIFAGWSGCDVVAGAGCTVTVGSTRFVTALFSPSGSATFATLQLNGTTFGPGDLLAASLTVSNAGPAALIDVYAGVLMPAAAGPGLGCPAGDPVAFVTPGGVAVTCLSAPVQSFPALVRAATLPASLPPTTVPGFFQAVIPAGAPVGSYLLFFLLTPAGAFADGRVDPADLLALATAGFAIGP